MNNDVSGATALARAEGALVVLSYVGDDGTPRMRVPARVQSSNGKQLMLSVDGPVLDAVRADPRVSLLLRAAHSQSYYQVTGRAQALTDANAVVVDLEQVEVIGKGPSLAAAPPAREPDRDAVAQPGSAALVPGVAVLQVADLTIYYGSHRAVNDLSFEVWRGEIFGLLGPNGAGKTSTLSAIEGLLRARSGRIMLEGTDVQRHPTAAKAKMGVQLQSTSFQSSLTIRQIVRLFAGLYGVRMTEAEVGQVIATAGLEAEAGKPYKQLSGGQQQRLALQIAVVHDPVLLLLDEPTSGLDPQARRQLWGRIEALRTEGGSILLTTHSMEEAQAVCDRVAIMDHGEILTVGPPLELIARHSDDPRVLAVAHGDVTLDDVFVGLTGSEIRD